MTREKALKVWHDSVGFNEVECSYKLQEAISTAFRELEKEPCEDCVSRQAAIALAKDIYVPTKDGTVYKHRCIDPDEIRELPPVTPQPKLEILCRKALENTLDEIYDHMCPEVIKDSSGDTHGYYPENYEDYEKMYEIIKGNFKDIYPDLFKGGMYD